MQKIPLSYRDALSTIHSVIKPLPACSKNWRETFGYTLSEDIHAVEDVPLYDNSAMDGFAVQAHNTVNASEDSPVTLTVIENIYADRFFPQYEIKNKQAAKIMTGAPIPKGADAVIMVEKTKQNGQSVSVFSQANTGDNIRKQAEEIQKGQIILQKGTRIGSAEFGLIASQGITTVPVHNIPTVAIMPTGNELVEPDQKNHAAQIRNVNGYTLEHELVQLGCKTLRLGIGKDNPKELKQQIQQGLEQAGVLLTSGGVSMGEKDFLPAVFEELGMNIHFHKVAIKPGKPLLFAEWNGKYVFGLPGNVVSTMASFHLFIKPALRLLSGRDDWQNPVEYVRAGQTFNNPGNRINFIRCRKSHPPNELPIAFPTGKQGSGMLSSMIGADGFIAIPANVDHVKENQILEFIPILSY